MSVAVPKGPYTPLTTYGQVKAAIVGRAYANDLDPAAVEAVVLTEGGLTPAAGHYDPAADGSPGWSYGPFQLRDPGALPIASSGANGPGEAFAWSTKGINYAVDNLVPVAAGLSGAAAIDAIVNGFEHPANVAGEEAKALANYNAITGGKTINPQVPNEGGPGVNVTGPGGTQTGPAVKTSGFFKGLEDWLTQSGKLVLAYLLLVGLAGGLFLTGLKGLGVPVPKVAPVPVPV